MSTTYLTINNIYLCCIEFDAITFIDALWGVHALIIGSIVFFLTIYYPRKNNQLNIFPLITIILSLLMIGIFYYYGVHQEYSNYS